ncbi:phage distal tail protein [Kitasatospora purpeofusca]|uniref:phage distal tail protein n=1 Tax=Kitasatospora purpeofusca TaxID=67352 RepID=UPI0037FE2828
MAGELITADRQIQWAGQLWGDGTDLSVVDVPGWDDLASVDDASVPRPQQHGSLPGRLLTQSRAIACTMQVTCLPEDWPALRRTLRAATALCQDEQPLVIRLAGEPLLAWARITRRAISTDTAGVLGNPVVSLLFEASDPRLYEVAEHAESTPLPGDETGLSFGSPEVGLSFGSPVEVGLDFGAPGATGDIIATNAGTEDTHPLIEIRGPASTPTLTLGALRLEYDLALAATDVLVIDTRTGAVTLGGQDRSATATARSAPEQDFALPPGQSVVAFRAAGTPDPAASATLRWRSAYL